MGDRRRGDHYVALTAEPSSPPAARRRTTAAAAASPRLALFLVLGLFAGWMHWGRPLSKGTHSELPGQRLGTKHADDVAGGGGELPGSHDSHASSDGDERVRSRSSAGGLFGSVRQQSSSRTLSFSLCGGFAGQRIALVSGLAFAAELNRTAVLPRLLRDGAVTAPLSDLYDLPQLLAGLRAAGLSVQLEEPAAKAVVQINLAELFEPVQGLSTTFGKSPHIKVTCPALRVPASLIERHESLVFVALAALQPATHLQDVVMKAKEQLWRLGGLGGRAYTVLQLKAEQGWEATCAQRWERVGAGAAPDNCATNTEAVGELLEQHRVDRRPPVLLVTNWNHANLTRVQGAIGDLKAHGYKLQAQDSLVVGGVPELAALAPDEAALVSYYLALGARQFMGSSVSAFGALAIIERRHADRWSGWYNGGTLPLEHYLPLLPLPWVFTFNSWSEGGEAERLLRAAVSSAVRVGRVRPFCLFSGAADASPMFAWLEEQGVTLIQHEPAWREALAAEAQRHKGWAKAQTHAALYASDGAVVGALQRVDLPLVKELDEFHYVLYTDGDVLFRRRTQLSDWAPLPAVLSFGYEAGATFPFSDSVALWNLPAMRRTSGAFVDWIMAQRNGLYWPGYGALTQGAFNAFYERELLGNPAHKPMSAALYEGQQPQAAIAHMHGPKLSDYLQYLKTGACSFGAMCSQAYESGSLCLYAAEISEAALDWADALELHGLCSNIAAGVWSPPWEQQHEAAQQRLEEQWEWQREAAQPFKVGEAAQLGGGLVQAQVTTRVAAAQAQALVQQQAASEQPLQQAASEQLLQQAASEPQATNAQQQQADEE